LLHCHGAAQKNAQNEPSGDGGPSLPHDGSSVAQVGIDDHRQHCRMSENQVVCPLLIPE
jgi:hypothetical protein